MVQQVFGHVLQSTKFLETCYSPQRCWARVVVHQGAGHVLWSTEVLDTCCGPPSCWTRVVIHEGFGHVLCSTKVMKTCCGPLRPWRDIVVHQGDKYGQIGPHLWKGRTEARTWTACNTVSCLVLYNCFSTDNYLVNTAPCPVLYNWLSSLIIIWSAQCLVQCYTTGFSLIMIWSTAPCPILYNWFFTDNHLINIRLYLTWTHDCSDIFQLTHYNIIQYLPISSLLPPPAI